MMADRIGDLLASYQPDFFRLEDRITAAVFPLMKIIPAEFCVRRAVRDGVLTPGNLVLESSSGTMGLGLAIVCRWLGFPSSSSRTTPGMMCCVAG